ncbi:hypothetical protein [Variovorax ginsengisoli]|uniref:Uncharacterized protein n=1 Tax=Variovorax ginsengisoli TaxID=363844 RepID=A0ABT8SEB1_9BURK|nr:hypothetical protein [Variovorax ginsengisoli]MDN8617162.1 hypothetical protein [Variovorax ginsengisoli]MDO1536332.1 hypothetical protein [Variovorax ginsengisoli]
MSEVEGATGEFKVRYCTDPPATLRRWCDAHAHQIEEFDSGDGYATDSGFAYDIMLRRGWPMSDDWVHILIEPTVKDMLRQLRSIG